jgi:hypothetical protein
MKIFEAGDRVQGKLKCNREWLGTISEIIIIDRKRKYSVLWDNSCTTMVTKYGIDKIENQPRNLEFQREQPIGNPNLNTNPDNEEVDIQSDVSSDSEDEVEAVER